MKKIVAFLALSSSLFAYNTYEAPFEGSGCISQGWSGNYSHGIITNKKSPHYGKQLAYGVDIGGSFEVLSPAKGTVVKVYKDDKAKDTNAGNTVIIKFEDGLYGQFIHLAYNKVYVKEGDPVLTGTPIAMSGNTGKWSEGAHLHMQFSTVQSFITDLGRSRTVGINAWDGNKVWDAQDYTCQNGKGLRVGSNNKKRNSSTPTPSSISLTTPSNGSSVSGTNISLGWTNPNKYPSHRWIISTDKSFIDGLTPSGDWSCSSSSSCATNTVSNNSSQNISTTTGTNSSLFQSGRTYYWKVRSTTANTVPVMSSTGNFKTPATTATIREIKPYCSPSTLMFGGSSGQCSSTAYFTNGTSKDISSATTWSVMTNPSALSISSSGVISALGVEKDTPARVKITYGTATPNGTDIIVKGLDGQDPLVYQNKLCLKEGTYLKWSTSIPNGTLYLFYSKTCKSNFGLIQPTNSSSKTSVKIVRDDGSTQTKSGTGTIVSPMLYAPSKKVCVHGSVNDATWTKGSCY